jgi:hypothetical protein
MELIDNLKDISAKIDKQASNIKTEEATKTAFVLPFISALGYDIFDPSEVVPELDADVGKKGEKVDYAIIIDEMPIILMECKSIDVNLDNIRLSQLYRYFSVTDARFGILTNGVMYRFYTDIDEANKMDPKPFLEIDLSNLSKYSVKELKKFTKPAFNLENILESASVLKYTREIKKIISQQMDEPNDDFVRILAKNVYPGPLTKHVRDQFKGITKTAFNQYVNDLVNDRIESALDVNGGDQKEKEEKELHPRTEIIITEEEWEAFYIVRSIISQITDDSRIAIRERKYYCNMLLDDNQKKIILRLHITSKHKFLGFFDKQERDSRGTRIEDKVPIENISEIYKFKDRILKTVKTYDHN